MGLLSNLKNAATAYEDRSMNVDTKNLVGANEGIIRNLPRDFFNKNFSKGKDISLSEFFPTIFYFLETLWYNRRKKIFYLWDSGFCDVNRHIIFMSDFQAEILKKSNAWIVGETFKSVSSQFEQLITLQGKYLRKFWPAGHALLVTITEAGHSP